MHVVRKKLLLLRRHGRLRMIDRYRIPAGAIPIIINSFNRLDSLRTQVDWLLGMDGEKAIIILDNASTYPPLLEYYNSLSHANVQVVFLGYNSGLEGIGDVSRELAGFPTYVVTDPDLVPYPETPGDILPRMRAALDACPDYSHVGASMEFRDLPESYPLRDKVVAWESRFWPPAASEVHPGLYEAWVDTTFAMYRGNSDVSKVYPAVRMARPYTLKHVDWYIDPDQLSHEQAFYMAACGKVASWTTKFLQRDE